MKHLKILNAFAKNKAAPFNVDVEISDFQTSFKPNDGNSPAHYEDVMWLSSIITGTTVFLYWLERNGYKICKKSRKG